MGIAIETGCWTNLKVMGFEVSETQTLSLTVTPELDIVSLFDLEYIGQVTTLRNPTAQFVWQGGEQYALIENKGNDDLSQRYFIPLEVYKMELSIDIDPEIDTFVYLFDWHITPAGWLMEYELEAVAA